MKLGNILSYDRQGNVWWSHGFNSPLDEPFPIVCTGSLWGLTILFSLLSFSSCAKHQNFRKNIDDIRWLFYNLPWHMSEQSVGARVLTVTMSIWNAIKKELKVKFSGNTCFQKQTLLHTGRHLLWKLGKAKNKHNFLIFLWKLDRNYIREENCRRYKAT